MDIRRLLAELKGRGVYRVAAIYAAGSWALLQVADVFFPLFGLPGWAISTVLVAAAIGFPVALVLSWIFDFTPEGIVETDSATVNYGRFRLSPARLAELLLLLALVGLVGFLYLERLSFRPTDSPAVATAADERVSIAVLPFVNMSGSKEVEYFGDGLAEEILNLLAKLPELDVAARTSAFYFKGRDIDIRQIGKQLSVAHVLEGSVRRQGDTIRVTAQLIEVATGYHLWSETFDRDFRDVLSIQDDVARSVVDHLQIILSSGSENVLASALTLDPQAYDFYLQARDYLRRPGEGDNYRRAAELFDKAIELDPGYADAYAGRCEAYIGIYRRNLDPEHYEAADTACAQALVLDEEAVAVYVARGNLYVASGNYGEALQQFNRAIELAPADSNAHIGLADAYRADNKPSMAEQMYMRAIELEPNNWQAYTRMGAMMFEMGRIEEAVPYYRRITELMPDNPNAYTGLGSALYLSGDYAAAVEVWQRSLELEESSITYSNLGSALFFQGLFKEASDMYQQAVKYAPENFENWGNLGDAYRFAPGLEELAEPMFENALKLASDRLGVNPSDADTLGLVGYYHANLGQRDDALVSIARAGALAPKDMYTHYYAASTYIVLGEEDKARSALQKALEFGYSAELVRVDATLGVLREDPILAEIEAAAD